MPEPPERTALYRLFSARIELLYIGVSADPQERLKVHRWGPYRMTWAAEVVRQTVEWHPSRSQALKAEARAIRAEHPQYNGTHNFPLAPFGPGFWPRVTAPRGRRRALTSLILREIDSGRWMPGMKIPSCGAMAGATGISETTATLAIRDLQQEGRLKLLHGVGVFVYDGNEIYRPNRSTT